MNTEDFLSELQHSKEINIIGPFLSDNEFQLLKKDTLTIYIDGGSSFIESLKGINRYICVGDGDSSNRKMDICLPVEKNISDLGHALSFIPNSVEVINLRGFLGGRKDHELCNIGEIEHYLSKTKGLTQINWSENMKSYSQGNVIIKQSGTFSILSLSKNLITLSGLVKYPLLNEEVSPLSSLCLSNIASGEFKISSTRPFTIYFATQSELE